MLILHTVTVASNDRELLLTAVFRGADRTKEFSVTLARGASLDLVSLELAALAIKVRDMGATENALKKWGG